MSDNTCMSASPRPSEAAAQWNWYHVVLTTCGAWIHAGPVRTRRRVRREPIMHRAAGRASCRLGRIAWVSARHRRIELPGPMRAVVGEALRDMLSSLGATVVVIAVSRQHVHILARMPRGLARKWASAAKRHALTTAAAHGWHRKLWGKRSKAAPVRAGSHQLLYYMLRNLDRGAWSWSIRDTASAPLPAVCCN